MLTRAMIDRLSETPNTPRITWITVAIALTLTVGVGGWVNRDNIAVLLAPAKEATSVRSNAALQADEFFWHTFHSGAYDEISRVLEVLTASYLETPTDAVTAAHIAWFHNWRMAERARLSAIPERSRTIRFSRDDTSRRRLNSMRRTLELKDSSPAIP